MRELAANLKDPVILPCDVARDEDLRVLAEGVQKVRGGMTVNPKPLTTTAEAQPAPAAPTR